MAQVMDHAYTGEHRRGASCQFIYPDARGGICARMASEHGPIPTVQPEPVSGRTLRERVQTYWFTVSGQDPLPGVRNPDGPKFLPDAVMVEWRDGTLNVTVQGPRINAEGRPLKRDRLLTSYDQEDITSGDMPGWVIEVVQAAVDAHSWDYWERATAGLPRQPAFGAAEVGALLADCTHGADCQVHPDASGLHNRDATAAEALDAVMAAVLIRHKFDADDVRDIAAKLGVELRR